LYRDVKVILKFKTYTERTILLRDLKFYGYKLENNFAGILKMSNAAKNLYILTTSSSVLHKYFDNSTKSFFDLYPVKILDFSAKPSFLHKIYRRLNK